MGAEGTAHPQKSPGKTPNQPKSGAKSGAVDAELTEIAALWPQLAAAARTAILALAKCAAKHSDH
jgi:hypothetical protein